VALYHDLTAAAAYLNLNRQGRGKPLTEGQRREVWTLMQAYENLLEAAGSYHLGRIANILARHLAAHPAERPFSHVIVDEVQDFGMPELRLIRQLVDPGPDDLFLAGDPLQKIYHTRFRFSDAGISIRGQRSQRLRINYRTSEEIRQAATAVITGLSFDDFDGGAVQADDSYSLFRGEAPAYTAFPNDAAEIDAVVKELMRRYQLGEALEEMCVAGFHRDTVKRITDALHEKGLPYYDLRKSKGTVSGLRVSSLHGLKGMEFRAVYLLALGQGQYPHRFTGFAKLSETEQAAQLKGQQALLYVAMSRARDRLWISGVGRASAWVERVAR
jgi:superfamily I DNA/RNA helicase